MVKKKRERSLRTGSLSWKGRRMKLDNRIGRRKNSNIWIWNELKNEQIKEDKIEKLIESFQIRVTITISPKGGSEKKENLFNCEKKILSCLRRNSSNSENRLKKEVQANKSTGRMPWHQEPTKDVTSCDKPRGAANKHRSGDFRMGKPTRERNVKWIHSLT